MMLRVVAEMASALAGDAPQLDGLLVALRARPENRSHGTTRASACPPVGDVPIPIPLRTFGGHSIYRCSSPIMIGQTSDIHEHYHRRFPTEKAELLTESERGVVATTNGIYKSYRLPLRVRRVDRVVWFAEADRQSLLQVLKRSAHAIGRKTGMGYGRVAKWTAEAIDDDWTWFAKSAQGPVLMRPLPFCDAIPSGLQCSRRDYGACQPPYWHPDRYTEIVVPC